MAGYIDGQVPYQVSTLVATVSVQTPYLLYDAGAKSLAVPDPLADDTLAILTGTQTMDHKTLLNPVITTGSLTSPLITTADIRMTGGGTYSGGIMHHVVGGAVVVQTQAVGATKTLDFSTADAFLVNLTQNCTLTIANAASSKLYCVVVKQDITNSYTSMSWMTGFVNEKIASGPTQKTGATDFWQIFYNAPDGKHYAVGAKDVQS